MLEQFEEGEAGFIFVLIFLVGVAVCVFALSDSLNTAWQLLALPVGLAISGYAVFRLMRLRPG